MYKHQLNLEERRKKALDKHLDFLLGQTERCGNVMLLYLRFIIIRGNENVFFFRFRGACESLPLFVPWEGPF